MGKAVLLALAGAAVLAAAASAITTNGFPDEGRHGAVGAILVPTRDGTGYGLVCSGTLVAERYFLTASHCTAFLQADPRPEYVTFDETDVENAPTGLIAATAITNPAYKGKGFRDDVSLLRLAEPVTEVEPAALPALGYLDTVELAQGTRLTTVGYGTSEKEVVKGEGPTFPFAGDRWYGIGSFNALTQEQLKMSQNPAHGDSGGCYGDSGGPTFLGAGVGEGDVVVAVTSTGDNPCYATNVSGRTDTPSARAFLSKYGL